jgi:ABC-2 type transport system permease protein
MIAVFRRELAGLFQTVIGWLYIAATVALFSLYCYAVNLSYGDPSLSQILGQISFIMLISAPVLTMRSLSEERRSKTDQLLLTSPISVGKIVVAKYLAVAAVHTVAVLIMCVTPLIILANGGGTLAQNYVSLLGFWFYGLCALGIGVFVSSLSESQVIAAVLTFVFLFVGFMMSSITSLITGTDVVSSVVKQVMGSFDLVTPLQTFFDGCVSLTGAIYYVSVIALFLFLTVQVIQKRRWSVAGKRWSLSAFSAGFVAIGVAVVVFLNLFAGQLPTTITQIDVTAAQLYTLTDTTKDYLATLDKDVTIYVIGTEDQLDATVKQTLQKYQETSSHITVEYKDPYVNPTFYQQYTTDNIAYGTLIVVCGEISKVVDYDSLFQSEIDYTTYESTTTGYDGEGQIDSAIQYVTADELPTIYQLEGHNEAELSGNFSAAVTKANLTLNSLSLLTSETVPEDAQLVIISGPQTDLSADEATKLIDYVKTGGKLLVILGYNETAQFPQLDSALAEFEVSELPGLVIENDQNMFYQGQWYLLPTVASSEYTASVGDRYIFAPDSKAVSYPESAEGITYTPLLTTSESSINKADPATATGPELEEDKGDTQGPLTVGLAASKTIDDKTATLVIFGSLEMFTDNADAVVSNSNSAMFADTITALTSGGSSGTVVVPVKAYDTARVTISAMAALLWGIVLIGLVPLLCLGAGVFIWYRRRKS